jgi:hypothetical protein
MRLVLLSALMILLYSCNKDHVVPLPTPNVNDNLNADISIAGKNSYLGSTGSNTIFSRTVNSPGDTSVVAYGADSNIHIQIVLENIHVSGTYIFGQKLNSDQHISVVYIIGDILSGNPIFYTANNQDNPGEIIIESISDKYVKGTFNATCPGTADTAKISNGSFEGNFQ